MRDHRTREDAVHVPRRGVSKGRQGAGSAAPHLYSLTGEQASLLRQASAQAPRGAYIPVVGHVSRVSCELANGGAAEIREEPRTSDTPKSARDPRPCTWTDLYLVPTPYGLELLARK